MIQFDTFSVKECKAVDIGFGVATWQVPTLPMYVYLSGATRLIPEVHMTSRISAADVVEHIRDLAASAAVKNPLYKINVFVKDVDVTSSRAADPTKSVYWITVSMIISKPGQVLATRDGVDFIQL